ncbi:MAG: ankyrin repeat domain-containing protein [Aestuariivirga sp.]|nr:ankyrin repeat domain-containing protein [Aestuariivirga sp.]
MRARRTVLLAGAAAAFLTMSRGHTMAGADLHRAAAADDADRISALIASGAALDSRDADQRTPLLMATHANAIGAASALIAAGADVNAKDRISDTPFLYAAAEGRLEILRLILATGRANLADTNRYGGTGLIPAAHHGHPEVVRELLRTRIAVDHVNRLGWTALLETIILSDGGPVHQDILRQLIAAGADVNLADGQGVSPLAHARSRGYAEMVRMLEQAGAR